jgi:hypothetical protein
LRRLRIVDVNVLMKSWHDPPRHMQGTAIAVDGDAFMQPPATRYPA